MCLLSATFINSQVIFQTCYLLVNIAGTSCAAHRHKSVGLIMSLRYLLTCASLHKKIFYWVFQSDGSFSSWNWNDLHKKRGRNCIAKYGDFIRIKGKQKPLTEALKMWRNVIKIRGTNTHEAQITAVRSRVESLLSFKWVTSKKRRMRLRNYNKTISENSNMTETMHY